MTVILNKDGFLLEEWNSDKRKDEREVLVFNMGFFYYWHSSFKIDGTVTLLDLINIIKGKYITLLEMLTQSSIQLYIDEIDKECEENADEIKAIDIRKYYMIHNYGDEPSTIGEEIHCSGLYKEPYTDPNCPEYKHKHCAIEFTPWHALKDLPIIINSKATLLEEADYDNQKIYNTSFSVADFFNGLTSEICFFGSPDTRDDNMDGLKQSIKEIEDGTAELIPWDDVKGELDEKSKQ